MPRLAASALLLLVGPALSGCISSTDDIGSTSRVGPIALELDEVPDGAEVELLPDGLRLVWSDLDLPFEKEFTVPRGATLVHASSEAGANEALFVSMTNAETGRRRCQVPYVEAWDRARLGDMSCAGLTAVDALPAKWKLAVLGPEKADLVMIDLLAVPLDGPAAQLDLSRLSMATYELLPTEVVEIEAHDGAVLYAEVTRADTPGRVPVVVSSSPYNQPFHAAGEVAMGEYFVFDWAARGYAIVMADVRGFGASGGCVEVWGTNEQLDQATLVEWAASQPWSDGNVGFYGQSYLGTTAVEAAVEAPDALKAIIAVAPVNNAYDDWHFGGVPNGEHLLSPVSYQSLGAESTLEPQDPLVGALNAANGLCDPTLAMRASDPRAIYDGFYAERNFSARAPDVQAAVLFTQGFEDSNVKSAMITHWFNALASPKLGLFGHWIHQHPPRADQEVLFLAWMDQYVKGKDLGLDGLANAYVLTNAGTERATSAWPPTDPRWVTFYPDLTERTLGSEPRDGSASVLMDPTGATGLLPIDLPLALVLEGDVATPFQMAGGARLELAVTLQGAENAHVGAFLYDVGPDGSTLVTWGMANIAHRQGHDRYEPVAPGETARMGLPFLPTEHVVEAGHTLRLEVRAARVDDWALVQPAGPSALTVVGGADGTSLRLPTVPIEESLPAPIAAGH